MPIPIETLTWATFIGLLSTVGGIIMGYRTLTGKLAAAKEEARVAAEAAALKIARDTRDQMMMQQLEEIKRLGTSNAAHEKSIEKLQADADKRRESDIEKDATIRQFQNELKDTAATCKLQIERLTTELREVRAKLEDALVDKGKAEAQAAGASVQVAPVPAPQARQAPAPAGGAASGQVATGTIDVTLDVVPKDKTT